MMVRAFGITPSSSAPLLFLLAISLFLLLLLGFLAFTGYAVRNTKFEVSGQGLRIKGGIYGRFVPREDIVKEGVKIIDLDSQIEYKPRLRTNGIGLPGYKEGWFKLKNSERALLFVTDCSNVVYIPTDKDYSVMLSVNNAEEFYQTIELWK